MGSLKQKTLHGLTWAGISQVTKVVMQFSVTAILARLLEPGDFGLLGMANIFIYLGTLLNEQGFSSALIQNQNVDDRHYSTVFWTNIAFGLLLMSLLHITTPAIVVFFEHEELKVILETLSLILVLSSITVVPRALLSKQMDFRSLAIVDTVSYMTGGTVGIYLALNEFGVISLVYQTIVQMAVAVVLYWFFSKWRPRLFFSVQAIKDIYRFGMHITGTSVLSYAGRNIDNLLIGKFLGADALGYYSLAFKLMMLPIRHIAWMVSQVMYPAYSHIQHDVNKIREHYLIMLKAVCLVTFPMLFILFAMAPEFVFGILGPDWEPAILIIRLLCIAGIIKVIVISWSSVLLSRGRSGLHFRLTLIGTLTLVMFMLAGLPWGIYGVTALYALHHILWLPFAGSKALASIQLPIGKVSPVILRSITLCLPMLLVVAILKLTVRIEPLQALLVYSIAGTIVYAIVVFYSENRFILSHLPKKMVRDPDQ